jgi:GNAT superfamily N-acetyltransferase
VTTNSPPDLDSQIKTLHGDDPYAVSIVRVESDQHLNAIRMLFLEYAESLDFDLDFQDFKDELIRLPGEYASPEGCLMIAFWQGEPAGCVGLRKLEKDICEMKRLYVRSRYRALGVGKVLAESIIREATVRAYKRMRLDTVPSMKAARRLYVSMGFKEIEPYCYNPIRGATFWEKKLE